MDINIFNESVDQNFTQWTLPLPDLMTRNYEQIITERGEMDLNLTLNYSNVYDKIREKLFVCSESQDIELDDSQQSEFDLKYNIKQTTNIINKFKENISKVYLKKIEHSIIIQERRRLYFNFCESIGNSIKSINDITKFQQMDNQNSSLPKLTEKDNQLIGILQERIEWFYRELDIDNLINVECDINAELYYLKNKLAELSGVISPTICTICMENQVNWFIDPCGHTLCTNCKDKTENTINCHYCRTTKIKCCKIYL